MSLPHGQSAVLEKKKDATMAFKQCSQYFSDERYVMESSKRCSIPGDVKAINSEDPSTR